MKIEFRVGLVPILLPFLLRDPNQTSVLATKPPYTAESEHVKLEGDLDIYHQGLLYGRLDDEQQLRFIEICLTRPNYLQELKGFLTREILRIGSHAQFQVDERATGLLSQNKEVQKILQDSEWFDVRSLLYAYYDSSLLKDGSGEGRVLFIKHPFPQTEDEVVLVALQRLIGEQAHETVVFDTPLKSLFSKQEGLSYYVERPLRTSRETLDLISKIH
ncbi:hypothetical protein IE53DRAFT_390824 [Violaceomyces palustris]|uniref:Uncharacterized protein n=1 Tax=Violaceomyces palustris TaxID=1673888 RepID=A0ACD0NMP2_9BASI|nr:hypothetical protein IE53DRAFT_390824 [Violaceomyces palustris]